MVKNAFLILAHDRPEMLARLVARLRHPEVIFVVHIDARVGDDGAFRAAVGERPDMFFVAAADRVLVQWCGFSTIRAILVLLDRAFALGADRFTLISGQDYPVRPIGALLEAMRTEQDIIAVDRECRREGTGWFDHCAFDRYFGDYRLLSLREGWPWLGRLVGGIAARLPRRRSPMPIYYGSMWWSLTRDAVDRIRRFIAEEPVTVAWFRYVRVPDEMFFQSLLKKLRPDGIRYDAMAGPLRPREPHMAATAYVDFTGTLTGSPRLLDLSDLPAIQASEALFARKMDPVVSAGLMDALDEIAAAQTRQ